MKTRLVWIAAGLAILIAVALVGYQLIPAFHSSRALAFEYEALPEDSAILARTSVEGFGVHQGDAFPYIVEVLYDPAQVAEIDKDSLDMNVNLSPFELRDTGETEFETGAGTRVYRKAYTIQLIEGEVNTRYDFPSIVVRYRLNDAPGYVEKTIVPDPVYVVARFPEETDELELRPLRGRVIDGSRQRLTWLLWALGGFLGVLGVADLTWRVIPLWRATDKQADESQSGDVLAQAYRSLHSSIASGAEPGRVLRQMDYMRRMVIARQTEVGWLEELAPEHVPGAIRRQVISLSEMCQQGVSGRATEKDVEAALRLLDEILVFYYGADVDTWKR